MRAKDFFIYVTVYLLVFPNGAFGQSSNMVLEAYLKQVKSQNESLKANDLSVRSFQLRAGEASMDFMPYAIGAFNYSDDKRTNSLTNGLGTEGISETGDLGVQTKLRTGTQLAFTYNLSYSKYIGSPFFTTNNVQYTASPVLTITQPLWRDFNASLSKAMEEATLAALKSEEMDTRYKTQNILFDAENAYWTLALEREIVKLDRESIERTGKILKRNERRVSMNVTDRSDLLQSLASLKTKELSYQKDIEDLRQAGLKFNSLRNISNDSVPEGLLPVEAFLSLDLEKEIKRRGIRADVQKAIADAISKRANAKASTVKTQPDIALVGSYQFDGRGVDSGTAMGTSWNGDNPYLSAGITLKIPLDLAEVSRMNEGYQAQIASAEATAHKAQFDLDQDWIDLQKHFRDALSRLTLAKELEKLQGEKLRYERERFNAGRTTSFQVLQFEDNFSDASLARLRVENELITMRAKARLYNGEVQ